MRKHKTILLHVIFWLYYLIARWTIIDKGYYDEYKDPIWLYKLFSYYILYFCWFYTSYFFILPKLLFAKKFIWAGIVISSFFWLMFHTESWIWSGLVFDKFLHPEFIQGWDQFYDISYMFFFSVGIYLWDKWGEVTEKKELLEKEVKQSELKFLKSQLSPHFLFNTLNTIYGLSIYNNPNTATAIRELKTTLNYIEKYNSKEGVVLESEIENLKSYIAINNLRFDNDVKFKIEVENPALKIEPMLFLPFIENAFKHGDNKSDSDIIIELEQKKDYLKFKIINDFSGEKRKDTVSGVGVENVKKRLSILYPNAKIAIQNSGNKFSVFIHLKGLVK